MYFGLTDEAVALRDGLREVLSSACSPKVIRSAWDGDPCESLWRELGSFGLPGLLVPEDRGGLGLDELAFVAAMEEVGWAGAAGPVMETVICAPVLDLPTDGTARITVFRQGTPWARTSTHALIDNGPPELLDLTQLSLTAIASVDGARQLAELPGPGAPIDVSDADMELLRLRGQLGTAALLLGLARRQLDITVAYAKERTQFGVPIGSFQAIKHSLADAVVGTEFAWPVVLHAAYSVATGASDARVRVAHAKAAASEASYRMSRVCLQAHGAIGYTTEYDLHLFMKRTWALAKDWGTAEQHRANVASHLLERTSR